MVSLTYRDNTSSKYRREKAAARQPLGGDAEAYQAGERTWFVGDATPFEGAYSGGQVAKAKGLDRLKVRPSDAAEWFLRMPMRRHLVPQWVATILRPAPIEGAAAEPSTAQRLAQQPEPGAAKSGGRPPKWDWATFDRR